MSVEPDTVDLAAATIDGILNNIRAKSVKPVFNVLSECGIDTARYSKQQQRIQSEKITLILQKYFADNDSDAFYNSLSDEELANDIFQNPENLIDILRVENTKHKNSINIGMTVEQISNELYQLQQARLCAIKAKKLRYNEKQRIQLLQQQRIQQQNNLLNNMSTSDIIDSTVPNKRCADEPVKQWNSTKLVHNVNNHVKHDFLNNPNPLYNINNINLPRMSSNTSILSSTQSMSHTTDTQDQQIKSVSTHKQSNYQSNNHTHHNQSSKQLPVKKQNIHLAALPKRSVTMAPPHNNNNNNNVTTHQQLHENNQQSIHQQHNYIADNAQIYRDSTIDTPLQLLASTSQFSTTAYIDSPNNSAPQHSFSTDSVHRSSSDHHNATSVQYDERPIITSQTHMRSIDSQPSSTRRSTPRQLHSNDEPISSSCYTFDIDTNKLSNASSVYPLPSSQPSSSRHTSGQSSTATSPSQSIPHTQFHSPITAKHHLPALQLNVLSATTSNIASALTDRPKQLDRTKLKHRHTYHHNNSEQSMLNNVQSKLNQHAAHVLT